MKVYGCWYEACDSGTWLTWFINQHEDFPKFNLKLEYQEKGKEFGNIPSDYSCDPATWHVDKFENRTVGLSFADHLTHVANEGYTNEDYSKFCYKILPWHNPIQTNQHEFPTNETPEQVCTRLLKDSNTDCVIIPQVEISYKLFAFRQAFIRPRYTVAECMKSFELKIKEEYKTIADKVRQLSPVHTVAIDKLIIDNDEKVYKELIDILEVPALPNWKEYANNYYDMILRPWENIDFSMLDNRTHKYTDNN